MYELTLRVIFSGLVAVVGATEEGKHSALLLEPDHHATILMSEGYCLEGCAGGGLPPFLAVAELETMAAPVAVAFNLYPFDVVDPQADSTRRAGRDGATIPTTDAQGRDFSWNESLAALEDPVGPASTPVDCLKVDCDLRARFTIPGGVMSTCHVVHYPTQVLPPPVSVACKDLVDWPPASPRAWIPLETESGQAAADAAVLEYTVTRKQAIREVRLELTDAQGKTQVVKLQPHWTGVREERLTLLVLNEPTTGGGQLCQDEFYPDHDHFAMYSELYQGAATVPALHFDMEQAQWGPSGDCEGVFTCLQAVRCEAVASRQALVAAGEVPAGTIDPLYSIMMPHNRPQCDSSSYP
jgi:hypothetical protein